MSLIPPKEVSDISDNGRKESTTFGKEGDIFDKLVHFMCHA